MGNRMRGIKICDCYNAKCKVCGTDLPVHLGDWLTKRDEIECYCKLHLPEENVRVFELKESYIFRNDKGRQIRLKIGWKMGIRDITDNARKNKLVNTPNLGVDYSEIQL